MYQVLLRVEQEESRDLTNGLGEMGIVSEGWWEGFRRMVGRKAHSE